MATGSSLLLSLIATSLVLSEIETTTGRRPILVQSPSRMSMVSREEAVGIVNASQSMVRVKGEGIERIESL